VCPDVLSRSVSEPEWAGSRLAVRDKGRIGRSREDENVAGCNGDRCPGVGEGELSFESLSIAFCGDNGE